MDNHTANALILKLWAIEEHIKAITRELEIVEDHLADTLTND